jgi:eukaryotic-like serine/threonine-protein kinase
MNSRERPVSLQGLDSETWHRIDEALDELIDLPPEKAGAALDRLYGRDPALHRQVAAILATDRAIEGYLSRTGRQMMIEGAAEGLDFGLPPPSLVLGTHLGTYEILGPLGAGGMGEVYRAKDLRLGREVAVKVLPARVASSAERLAQFEREARTVAGLNHPSIVTLFSVEDVDGIRFLTMELVEGQTLSHQVVPGGQPLSRILELAIPLTDALTVAHERGVIHRDLKPGNVMVTRDGRVKVLDFGLAKMMGADGPPSSLAKTVLAEGPESAEKQVVGTLPYMAPEQLRGDAMDTRSDLFSLGIILYELATGRRPFAGTGSAEVKASILRDTPVPLRRVRADLPGDFERIVSRCLEKDPGARPEAAREVNRELRRLRTVAERGEPEQSTPATLASIAVLPFVNRSSSVDDEYFSDGLADELLSVLSKIKGLRVIARTSSFQFRGLKTDIATIGRKLNVATLLDGSVRKAGNRIRVSVQLVRVSDSSHLWSETYDRTLQDILAVQDDIAKSVVKELRTTLLGDESDSNASRQVKAEVAQAARGRGTDPEAHRLYLLARHLLDRGTREDTARAILYFKECLDRDPKFALAWAYLARAYIMEGGNGWAPVAEGYGRAREAVERALALEPDLPEGHARMAWIRIYYDWDLRGAEVFYTRALELASGNALVLAEAAMLARALGRVEEPRRLLQQALEQDPLSAVAYHRLGIALHDAGCFAEAEGAYRKALELAPNRIVARAALSVSLLAQGRGEEALAEALREPDVAFRHWALAIVHHALGHRVESDAALRELIAKRSEEAACQIAEVYGARGEADKTFEWLERAFTQRDAGIIDATASQHLRSLHGDPRWQELQNKLGREG